MNGLINFEGYLSAVESKLSSLDIFKTVGIFSEIPDGYATPAIFFEIEDWSKAQDVNIGGNLTVSLTCNFYIVREIAAEGYNRKLRNAALAFTGWVHGRQFGPGTAPAEFVSAQDGDWYKDEQKELASHHVWCVTIEQNIAVGLDEFEEPDAPLLKELWLAFAPDIGPEHADDYILVAKSEES